MDNDKQNAQQRTTAGPERSAEDVLDLRAGPIQDTPSSLDLVPMGNTGSSRALVPTNTAQSEINFPASSQAKAGAVKHIECAYFFAGGCRFPAEQCLYAHHETGIRGEMPHPKRPGGK